MKKGRIVMIVGAGMLSIGMVMTGWGCASKRVASTSGGQSTMAKPKAAADAKPGTERIQPEQVTATDLPIAPAGSQVQEARTATPEASAPGQAPKSAAAAPGSTTSAPQMQVAKVAPVQIPPRSADLSALGDVFFDFDEYAIRKDALGVLEGNARLLRLDPGKSLLIAGHCDERGTLAYNLVLGEKRAKSAKHYLEDLGIPGSRIQTTSFGEIKPFCTEHNEACWQKNRRAHFVAQ